MNPTPPPAQDGAVPPPDAKAILDRTHALLAAADITGMDAFVQALNAIRRHLPVPEWRRYIETVVAAHPVRALIHEEPFTWRAYTKPRGYPGDAKLLDLVYADEPPSGSLTALGATLYDWAIAQPACRSVQARRGILAGIIDRIAAERPAPRILSVACGHLREAQRSEAVRAGAIAEFVALDQDAESLAVVEREQQSFNVVPVRTSIRRLLVDGTTYGTFDLAYAAGLYDYLDEPVAQALTASMFQALRPGGTLVVANFAPELRDIGYMEAVMDWRLLYRSEPEVERFAARIPPGEIAAAQLFRDDPGNVVYLSIQRT
jgi:SAM-dependent methyltransferase